MPIVTVKPTLPAPAAPTDTAGAARAAALAMLSTSTIDDSAAPVEKGEEAEVPAVKDPDEGEKPAEVEKEGEKPAEVEKKPEEKVEAKKEGLDDPLKKSFERLALEKKEQRDREANLKTREAAVAKYELLDKAAAAQDAMGALTMLGIPYSALVNQLTGGRAPADEPEKEAPAGNESEALKRVAALETQLSKERFDRNMSALHTEFGTIAKANAKKYPLVAEDPELIRQAHANLVEFVRRTGSPPGETREESIAIALEAVQVTAEKEAEKWRKKLGLTAAPAASNTEAAAPKSAVEPASELGMPSRTITNSHASAPQKVAGSTAKTPDELRAAALKILEAQG